MKVGISLPQLGPTASPENLIKVAKHAEALGYPTAWLGFGRASISDLALVERVLDATATITVATAIVNMWTNDARCRTCIPARRVTPR